MKKSIFTRTIGAAFAYGKRNSDGELIIGATVVNIDKATETIRKALLQILQVEDLKSEKFPAGYHPAVYADIFNYDGKTKISCFAAKELSKTFLFYDSGNIPLTTERDLKYSESTLDYGRLYGFSDSIR